VIRYLRGPRATGAEALTPPGAAAVGEEPLAVSTSLHVGTAILEARVLLGPWPTAEVDPAGPGGLLGMPVVVLAAGADPELARAGALRAGGWPTVLILPGDGPRLGIQLLVARSAGVSVALVEAGGGAHLRLARVLAGRPLPALALDRPEEAAAVLDASGVDLDIAIPSVPGGSDLGLSERLSRLRLEDRHHPVAVDPRPAFDELGRPIEDALPIDLSAAAAGVLAGRLAAAGSRWQSG
jgi:hypothetical protein